MNSAQRAGGRPAAGLLEAPPNPPQITPLLACEEGTLALSDLCRDLDLPFQAA